MNTIISELKVNEYFFQQSPTICKYLLADKILQAVRKVQKEEVESDEQ